MGHILTPSLLSLICLFYSENLLHILFEGILFIQNECPWKHKSRYVILREKKIKKQTQQSTTLTILHFVSVKTLWMIGLSHT